jgi:hypothetical protein
MSPLRVDNESQQDDSQKEQNNQSPDLPLIVDDTPAQVNDEEGKQDRKEQDVREAMGDSQGFHSCNQIESNHEECSEFRPKKLDEQNDNPQNPEENKEMQVEEDQEEMSHNAQINEPSSGMGSESPEQLAD